MSGYCAKVKTRQYFLENSNENTSKQALLQPGNRKCRFYVPNKNSGEGRGVYVLVVLGGIDAPATGDGEKVAIEYTFSVTRL